MRCVIPPNPPAATGRGKGQPDRLAFFLPLCFSVRARGGGGGGAAPPPPPARVPRGRRPPTPRAAAPPRPLAYPMRRF